MLRKGLYTRTFDQGYRRHFFTYVPSGKGGGFASLIGGGKAKRQGLEERMSWTKPRVLWGVDESLFGGGPAVGAVGLEATAAAAAGTPAGKPASAGGFLLSGVLGGLKSTLARVAGPRSAKVAPEPALEIVLYVRDLRPKPEPEPEPEPDVDATPEEEQGW